MLHFMQGTPYVYQGEELGMTNCPFRSIEDYRDIESINAYRELTEAGLRQPDELLECIAYKSRDNARTPMQWDDSPNAGFTTGQPWIMVNPNYTTVNAAAELADPNSVFHYYQNLIALRQDSKWSDVIVYGSYDLLAPEDEAVFAYTRRREGRSPGSVARQQKDGVTLLVVCNLSAQARTFPVPENVQWDSAELVTGNVPRAALNRQLALAPWQAAVWALA